MPAYSPGMHVPDEESLERPALERLQRRKLAQLLESVCKSNPFYRQKLSGLKFDAERDALSRLPLTTRAELLADQQGNAPYGSNLTFGLDQYVRFHQTSGSASAPLRWLDTADSWAWWRKCWGVILRASGMRASDRCAFLFSFGPFIGFWSAFDGAAALGALCLPAGGMSTRARLDFLVDNEITYLFCTPTYAMHLAETARAVGIELKDAAIRALVVAGEPGGNVPATRERLESAFGARVFDHAGMTEIGPWGFEAVEAPGGLLVLESEFVAEVLEPESDKPVAHGEVGELVLTNLGRLGSPLIRYRTNDLVRLRRDRRVAGRSFAFAEGGILGRRDDMLFVRGNNVLPTVLEDVLREIPEVIEYRIVLDESRPLNDLEIDVEPAAASEATSLARDVAERVRDRLHFRPVVRIVAPGALPRFEMKAKRVIRLSAGRNAAAAVKPRAGG